MTRSVVPDASALLALIQNETGATLVKDAITQGKSNISTVNLSEVIGKLAGSGVPRSELNINLEIILERLKPP